MPSLSNELLERKKIPFKIASKRIKYLEINLNPQNILCNSQYSLISRLLILSSKTKIEKAMAPHSSTLAWKILWTEEPGRL